MRRLLLAFLFTPGLAWAQQPPLDPRTAPHDMLALQAQVMALQAHLKAAEQDAAAQKATLWEWLLASEAKKERPEGRQ